MPRPHPPAYPHGELREVLPDVFFVNGSIKMGPLRASRTMIVVREGERLIVVNSLRMNDEGLAELDRLGKVTDVIRLGGFHGSDDPFYKERYASTTSAIEGQTYFRGINPDKGEVYFEADEYLGVGWLKSLQPDPEEIAGILDLEFDNVLPGHGQPVIGGAKDKYRPHIDAYVRGKSAT